MSTREEFSYFITCLRCGNQGELNVSEDDYPFMRNPNRAVEEIDGEFAAEVWRTTEELVYDWYPYTREMARYRKLMNMPIAVLKRQ